MGFRTEGRPGIDKGAMFLVDLAYNPLTVYGIGPDEATATADCLARKGTPYAPCCTREYGMHDRKCRGYLSKF